MDGSFETSSQEWRACVPAIRALPFRQIFTIIFIVHSFSSGNPLNAGSPFVSDDFHLTLRTKYLSRLRCERWGCRRDKRGVRRIENTSKFTNTKRIDSRNIFSSIPFPPSLLYLSRTLLLFKYLLIRCSISNRFRCWYS
jgi:hypothetical protein